MKNNLPQLIAELTAEIRVLRDAVDELREEVQWLANNVPPAESPPRFRLHSMSLDPAAAHFEVNPVPQDVVTRNRDTLQSTSGAPTQRDLF